MARPTFQEALAKVPKYVIECIEDLGFGACFMYGLGFISSSVLFMVSYVSFPDVLGPKPEAPASALPTCLEP